MRIDAGPDADAQEANLTAALGLALPLVALNAGATAVERVIGRPLFSLKCAQMCRTCTFHTAHTLKRTLETWHATFFSVLTHENVFTDTLACAVSCQQVISTVLGAKRMVRH